MAAYAAAHGHASPPQQYTTADGRPLGQWVSGQRRAHGHGRMLPQRIERLEGLPGWAWNVVDARCCDCPFLSIGVVTKILLAINDNYSTITFIHDVYCIGTYSSWYDYYYIP